MLRPLAALVALTALTAPLLVGGPAPAAQAAAEQTRLSGADRYGTAVAVSRAAHPTGAPVALLTTGATYPDALAGGPAAARLGGPVLLTTTDRVPDAVLAELDRLDPERVLVLGGPSAVSDTATAQLLQRGLSVERLAGRGRYDTAAAVSAAAFAPGVPVAYVATGRDFPDALAGAAAAGRDGGPVLLTEPDRLPEATAAELARLDPQRVVVLGGPAAVSAAVEEQLRATAPTSRVSGADRFATAVAVAQQRSELPASVYLANGGGFADALAGGPAAAADDAPVLLVRSSCLPEPAERELDRYSDRPRVLLGGAAVLGVGIVEERPCRRVPDGPLAPGVRLDAYRDPAGPFVGSIVTVAPSALDRLDVVLSNDRLTGLETTTSMARRTGALVAVNGDFALAGGRPVHAFAKDGRLLQTARALGRQVAVETRSGRTRLGFPPLLKGRLEVPATRESFDVDLVNDRASKPEALTLTTREGEGPPADIGCALAVRPLEGVFLTADGRTAQRYSTVATDCTGGDLDTDLDLFTAVRGGSAAGLLSRLRPGQELVYSWSTGWSDVLDTIGGNPTLVEGGAVVEGNVNGTDGFARRNPRTAVGVRPNGEVLLVTVDGRGAQGSVGMSLRELARLFVRLGATEALNLDGGGSTAMVVGGDLQNVPSDGPERPVTNALVVRGDAPASAALRRGAPAPDGPGDSGALTDPGSTGGLLTR